MKDSVYKALIFGMLMFQPFTSKPLFWSWSQIVWALAEINSVQLHTGLNI